jgi:hypothetical protein
MPLSSLRKNRLAAFSFSPRLQQHVEHVAVLIDRRPQIAPLAVVVYEHLSKVPLVAGSGAAPAQLVGVGMPELGTQRRIVS